MQAVSPSSAIEIVFAMMASALFVLAEQHLFEEFISPNGRQIPASLRPADRIAAHAFLKFSHPSKPVSRLIFTAHRIQFWLWRLH
jgi:hypothetical protein